MYSNLEYKPFYRRNLPHIQPEEGIFFITYRLAFTLPNNKTRELQQRRQTLVKNMTLSEYQKDSRLFSFYDDLLAKETSQPSWLLEKDIAELVQDNLKYHHSKRYELICYTIMSNHVHIIIRPLIDGEGNYFSLAAIMKWHKNYTALKANEILKRSGRFWNHENYDHFIRDDKELYRIIKYILINPVKGRLVNKMNNWPYNWLNSDYGEIPQS